MMTAQERKTTFSLAGIYAFRMLGLFMILPVFSLYMSHFKNATPALIGIGLGIYGLTQALLQIPFGMTSDRIGRKPVIITGLLLFMAGSVIAAMSQGIGGVIIGRALQGAGAVGSTLIALLADSTDEENRLKAMSVIGMTIGFSFMIGMVLGPILNSIVGLAGIFWLTALLAVIGIFILITCVPTPKTHILHRDSEPVLSQFKSTFKKVELLRLNFGIFSLHAMLMALFIAVPIIFLNEMGLSATQQWLIYLPVLVIACVLMIPFIIVAEAKRMIKPVFVSAIILLTACEIFLGFFHKNIFLVSIILCLFFTAFTVLEGILPSLVSKIAPAGSKGTAMGIYSSSQFLGIFFGGSAGGFIFGHLGLSGVTGFCSLLGIAWLFFAITMKKPLYLSSRIVVVNVKNMGEVQALQKEFLAITGVADVMIAPDEQVAYLKVDKKILDEAALNNLIQKQKK